MNLSQTQRHNHWNQTETILQNDVRHPSCSGHFLRVSGVDRSKGFFLNYPHAGDLAGRRLKGGQGPKLKALPLPLTLPGGGCRGASFIFWFFFICKIHSWGSRGSLKSMTELVLWEAGSGRWISVKMWSLWDLTPWNTHQTPLESQLSGKRARFVAKVLCLAFGFWNTVNKDTQGMGGRPSFAGSSHNPTHLYYLERYRQLTNLFLFIVHFSACNSIWIHNVGRDVDVLFPPHNGICNWHLA